MEWQTVRDWRDPGFWLPIACAAALVLGLYLLVDLSTHRYLAELESLRASDPEAVASSAANGLEWIGRAVCGYALIVAAFVARSCQLGLREQRLPPSGWWSLGARRVCVGPGARTLARLGLVLSALLAAAGIGCLVAVRQLIRILST